MTYDIKFSHIVAALLLTNAYIHIRHQRNLPSKKPKVLESHMLLPEHILTFF